MFLTFVQHCQPPLTTLSAQRRSQDFAGRVATFRGHKVTPPKINKSTDFVHYFLKDHNSYTLLKMGPSSLERPKWGSKKPQYIGPSGRSDLEKPLRPREGHLRSMQDPFRHRKGLLRHNGRRCLSDLP